VHAEDCKRGAFQGRLVYCTLVFLMSREETGALLLFLLYVR
jgi:hypothetical protein